MEVRDFSRESEWIEAALAELRASIGVAREEGRASIALPRRGTNARARLPGDVRHAHRRDGARALARRRAHRGLGRERTQRTRSIARSFAACAWSPPPRIRLWPDAENQASGRSACAAYEAALRASLGRTPRFRPVPAGPRRRRPHREPLPGLSARAARARSVGSYRRGSFAHRAIRTHDHDVRRPRIGPTKGIPGPGGRQARGAAQAEAEDPVLPASRLAGPGALACTWPQSRLVAAMGLGARAVRLEPVPSLLDAASRARAQVLERAVKARRAIGGRSALARRRASRGRGRFRRPRGRCRGRP